MSTTKIKMETKKKLIKKSNQDINTGCIFFIGLISLIMGLLIMSLTLILFPHIEEDLKVCKELGFDGIEISLNPNHNKCFKEVIYEDGTKGIKYSEGYVK